MAGFERHLEDWRLSAGATWTFEAPVLVEGVFRFRVESLTCWKTPESSEWEIKRACYIPAGRNRPPYAGDVPVRSG